MADRREIKGDGGRSKCPAAITALAGQASIQDVNLLAGPN
jgi:hypothetical protein